MEEIKTDLDKLLKDPLVQRYQIFVVPILSILVCIALIILLVIPQVLQIISSFGKINEYTEKNNFYRSKIQVLSQINTTDYKNSLNITLEALPTTQDIPGAISQILNLLNDDKLQLDTINFTPPVSGVNNVQEYIIKVEVNGNLSDFNNFLSTLEQYPRIMRVETLQVSPQNSSDTIQADLSIGTYFQVLATVVGGLDDPVTTLTSQDQATLDNLKTAVDLLPADNGQTAGSKGKADPFQ